jgi:hypothetical protein
LLIVAASIFSFAYKRPSNYRYNAKFILLNFLGFSRHYFVFVVDSRVTDRVNIGVIRSRVVATTTTSASSPLYCSSISSILLARLAIEFAY